jgi:hypothetical protein
MATIYDKLLTKWAQLPAEARHLNFKLGSDIGMSREGGRNYELQIAAVLIEQFRRDFHSAILGLFDREFAGCKTAKPLDQL